MPTEARKHEMLALLEVSGSKLSWKVGVLHCPWAGPDSVRRWTPDGQRQHTCPKQQAQCCSRQWCTDTAVTCFTRNASWAVLVFAAKLQRKEDEN